jgi:hypothetical protein
VNKVRCETGGSFRDQKREYLKEKLVSWKEAVRTKI